MARTTKKKDTAPATPAPEATTATEPEQATAQQEAHLDPGQLAEMDDATLQQLAKDMGLDPAAYADMEALIAAIAEVLVIPGPPEPEKQEDAQEPPQEAPEPVPVTERPLPLKAEVAVSVAVLRRAIIGTADMVKPVATLDKGATVTVVAFEGDNARLSNGLYIKTAMLA